jgi:hypothetical protein
MMNPLGRPTRHVRQIVMQFPDAPTNATRNVAESTDTIWTIGWKLSETFHGRLPSGRLPAHNRACRFADDRVSCRAAVVWTALHAREMLRTGVDVTVRSGGEPQYGASHGRGAHAIICRKVRATCADTKR